MPHPGFSAFGRLVVFVLIPRYVLFSFNLIYSARHANANFLNVEALSHSPVYIYSIRFLLPRAS